MTLHHKVSSAGLPVNEMSLESRSSACPAMGEGRRTFELASAALGDVQHVFASQAEPTSDLDVRDRHAADRRSQLEHVAFSLSESSHPTQHLAERQPCSDDENIHLGPGNLSGGHAFESTGSEPPTPGAQVTLAVDQSPDRPPR